MSDFSFKFDQKLRLMLDYDKMIKKAKTIFYFNQYFVIRLGENLYKYNSKIENFSFIRAFFTLLYYGFKNFKTKYDETIKKKYKHIVYVETLNQKNAIIDVFNLMEDKTKTLFVINNNIKIEGFDTVAFNNKKSFFLALLFLPKAYFISRKYSNAKKEVINDVHILVNLSLFIASNKIFEHYLKKSNAEKIILTNDHNLQTLSLLLTAKRMNVKSFYIQHASVSLAFPKLLPDVSLLEGQQAIDIYNQIGNLSRVVKLVGIARLDGVLSFKNEVREKDLVVGVCLKPYYSIELIESLILAINKSTKVKQIILRPHPGNTADFYKKLEQFNISISNARIERPHEFIKQLDVMISGESSIVLEATLMKVKALYIDDKIAEFDLYGFVKNGITTFAKNYDDLVSALNNINLSDVENNYSNSKYYCSTVNSEYENRSKELILKHLSEL